MLLIRSACLPSCVQGYVADSDPSHSINSAISNHTFPTCLYASLCTLVSLTPLITYYPFLSSQSLSNFMSCSQQQHQQSQQFLTKQGSLRQHCSFFTERVTSGVPLHISLLQSSSKLKEYVCFELKWPSASKLMFSKKTFLYQTPKRGINISWKCDDRFNIWSISFKAINVSWCFWWRLTFNVSQICSFLRYMTFSKI